MAEEEREHRTTDPLGRTFGPYRPVRRLGVGGMAETFEAIRVGRSGFSQRVCLKLVLPYYQDSQDFVQLFEQEARLAAKLRHSKIVGIIDFGESHGTPYMALEFVDGVDLQVLLDAQGDKCLSHELVAYIGHDLATALEHAHDPPRGTEPSDRVTAIIHRDISPSNVLLSRHGEVMLSDFGVAKAITQTAKRQSAVKGKVPYMSPEQLRMEPLDGRADLFGLGVVLFEALGGQLPFLREHDPATIMAILRGEHPSLHTLAPDAPEGLCDLIESLIRPDREDRPENATKLIELLEEFMPPPRVRRELGAAVEELSRERAEPAAPAHVALERTEPGGSSSDDAPQPASAGEPPSGVSRRHTGAAVRQAKPRSAFRWAVLGFAAAVVGGFLYFQTLPSAPPEPEVVASAPAETEVSDDASRAPDRVRSAQPEGASEPPPSTDAPDAAAPVATEPAVAESPPAERVAPAARPAKLSVIVYPWGRVWINGRARGMAPLNDVTLKPGRYKVAAGQDAPVTSKVIRLRSGERRSLTLRLEEE